MDNLFVCLAALVLMIIGMIALLGASWLVAFGLTWGPEQRFATIFPITLLAMVIAGTLVYFAISYVKTGTTV